MAEGEEEGEAGEHDQDEDLEDLDGEEGEEEAEMPQPKPALKRWKMYTPKVKLVNSMVLIIFVRIL